MRFSLDLFLGAMSCVISFLGKSFHTLSQIKVNLPYLANASYFEDGFAVHNCIHLNLGLFSL